MSLFFCRLFIKVINESGSGMNKNTVTSLHFLFFLLSLPFGALPLQSRCRTTHSGYSLKHSPRALPALFSPLPPFPSISLSFHLPKPLIYSSHLAHHHKTDPSVGETMTPYFLHIQIWTNTSYRIQSPHHASPLGRANLHSRYLGCSLHPQRSPRTTTHHHGCSWCNHGGSIGCIYVESSAR